MSKNSTITLLRCCLPVLWMLAFSPVGFAQAPCLGVCTTPIPCYNVTLQAPEYLISCCDRPEIPGAFDLELQNL